MEPGMCVVHIHTYAGKIAKHIKQLRKKEKRFICSDRSECTLWRGKREGISLLWLFSEVGSKVLSKEKRRGVRCSREKRAVVRIQETLRLFCCTLTIVRLVCDPG